MADEAPPNTDQAPEPKPGKLARLRRFVNKRTIVIVIATVAALWLANAVFGLFSPKESAKKPVAVQYTQTGAQHAAPAAAPVEENEPVATPSKKDTPPDVYSAVAHGPKDSYSPTATAPKPVVTQEHPATGAGGQHAAPSATTAHGTPASPAHGTAPAAHVATAPPAPTVKGVAFVNAIIEPMHHELYDRFWGWRPNDILNFTDNVNNFQLGTLEVTRRTAVILAERISRTGSTASFDRNLENAMNWFMIKATRYWFPSPESKYRDGLQEWASYRDRLLSGKALFYTRTDNLIPLLIAYEDLLGSCDENLVKMKESDGSPVSHFKADDYFYYAKGVASTMYVILEAIMTDFRETLEARRGVEVLHHAIESCRKAMEIDPIYITNSDLSGILANHRANMAAPISHARFHLGVLIKTLST